MFFMKMAMRNVFRQYGRTTLSMVSIIAGVFVIILGRGFVGGTKENMIRAQIDSTSGHVQVLPADYPEVGIQHPVDELLTIDKEMATWLDNNTEAWTTRTIFVARVINGYDSLRARVFGFDPKTDESVFPRDNWNTEGKIPLTEADGVMISQSIKRILNVNIGDVLTFEVRTPNGAINALMIPVSGIVSAGNPSIDRVGIFMPKPMVQKLVVTGENFSHLSVLVDDRDNSAQFAEKLKEKFGDEAKVTTWREEIQGMLDLQDMRQTVLDLIALMILAIAATGIANTVLMAAYERIREIGTLRAMGLTKGGVVALFVTEGVLMGLVGSIIGAILGGLVVWKYSVDGIDLSSMMESASTSGSYDNIPFSVILYLEFSMTTIVGATVVGLCIAVFSSIYPAVIASKMAPADAVRAE